MERIIQNLIYRIDLINVYHYYNIVLIREAEYAQCFNIDETVQPLHE